MQAWVETALSTAVAFVFAILALAKMRDRSRFVQSIAGYRVVPSVIAKPLAPAIIGLELGLAIGLVVPLYRTLAAAFGMVLLTLFGTAMGIVVLRGDDDVDCGCSLRREFSPVGPASLARSFGLILMLALIAILSVHVSVLGNIASVDAAACGVTAALIYLEIETIASLPILRQ
jgi:Methylamine utilisation protein MauE